MIVPTPLQGGCVSVETENDIAIHSVVFGKACLDHHTHLGHGGVGRSGLREMRVSSSCDHHRLRPCVLGGDDRDPFCDFPDRMDCAMTVFLSYFCGSFGSRHGVANCGLRLRLGVVDHCRVQANLKGTFADGDRDNYLGNLPYFSRNARAGI